MGTHGVDTTQAEKFRVNSDQGLAAIRAGGGFDFPGARHKVISPSQPHRDGRNPVGKGQGSHHRGKGLKADKNGGELENHNNELKAVDVDEPSVLGAETAPTGNTGRPNHLKPKLELRTIGATPSEAGVSKRLEMVSPGDHKAEVGSPRGGRILHVA